jgi:hypothetical protein
MLDRTFRKRFALRNVDAVRGDDQTLRALDSQCRKRTIEIVLIGLDNVERYTQRVGSRFNLRSRARRDRSSQQTAKGVVQVDDGTGDVLGLLVVHDLQRGD